MNRTTFYSTVLIRHLLAVFTVLAVLMSGVQLAEAQEDLTPIPMISGIEMLKVGDLAPGFTIGNLSGEPFNMEETLETRKGVLIFFWSIFCEPCKAELPVIQQLVDKYRAQGVEFVGVAIDGAPMKNAIGGFIKSEGYNFEVLIDELNPDESFKVSDPYGVAGTPTVYILDGTGTVQFAKIGRASLDELDAIINKLP